MNNVSIAVHCTPQQGEEGSFTLGNTAEIESATLREKES